MGACNALIPRKFIYFIIIINSIEDKIVFTFLPLRFVRMKTPKHEGSGHVTVPFSPPLVVEIIDVPNFVDLFTFHVSTGHF